MLYDRNYLLPTEVSEPELSTTHPKPATFTIRQDSQVYHLFSYSAVRRLTPYVPWRGSRGDSSCCSGSDFVLTARRSVRKAVSVDYPLPF